MSHDPTFYESFGRCIYCGDNSSKLSDEHIMPEALGGAHILRNASCKTCGDITSKFELDVCREMLGHFRYAHGGPGKKKRKKKRPSLITLPRAPGREPVTIPYEDYPAPAVLYRMGRAGFLQNAPSDLDLSGSWSLISLQDDARAEAFQKRFDHPLTATFKHAPQSFGRMIAKISYGQVLTTIGNDDFDAICLPYILGTQPNISYIVGGVTTPLAPEDVGYRMQTSAFGTRTDMWLVATIRFFANLPTPEYHAVVGRVHGAHNVLRVANKLGGGQLAALSPASAPHWAPAIGGARGFVDQNG